MPPKTPSLLPKIPLQNSAPLSSESETRKNAASSPNYFPSLFPSSPESIKSRHLEVIMCSSFSVMSHLKLHILQNSLSTDEDDFVDRCLAVDWIVHIVAYIAVSALIVVVFLWIMKFMSELSEERNVEGESIRPTETSPLCNTNVAPLTYRTCEEDLEFGNCDSSDESDDELYDGRLCVICYDEQRNSFFVPCGHCATCYDCAKRIFYGDQNRKCPVCRRLIGKVKRLLAP